MKLARSMCCALSLFLTVHLGSSAQTQDQQAPNSSQPALANGQAQPQSQPGQTNLAQQNPTLQPGEYRKTALSEANAQLFGPLNVNLIMDELVPPQFAPGDARNLGVYGLSGRGPQGQVWQYYNLNGDGLAWFADSIQSTGMSLSPADGALRAHLKLPKDQGLVVTALEPNCSAARAGVELNDVLLMLGETALAKPEDLSGRLKEIGEKPVALTLLRAGKIFRIHVQPMIRVTLQPVKPKPPEQEFWIGVTVWPVGPALRSQLQVPQGQGLIVNEVQKDSPAQKAGLKLHDIVLELDGKPLSEQAELYRAVQAHGESAMVLDLMREGRSDVKVVVKPEGRKTAPLSNATANHNDFTFFRVQPGALLPDATYTQGQVYPTYPSDGRTPYYEYPNANFTQGLPTSVSSRLDALDAELKELRRVVEELNKNMRIIPLNK